ncbi:FbpB family small basic protein [Alteribacillus bidgolensis]|uniref:Fur-regulated basic protein B n=1 Tax=Alteribacillus bidgolensis TaxID=930129 RepID=A0A1G8D4Z9_9BACI|nr:FbpB family small basic protein [Alteribacillus bidgolensis]SDH52604.1 Fur-regulated basic protein B [Alteribacillus bidgolensis]
MNKKKRISMKELLEENKQEILKNPSILEKIEEKWESKKAMK